MSKPVKHPGPVNRDPLVRARDADGRFLPTGEAPTDKTVANRRRLNERDYLRSIVAEVGREDVAEIARRIVEDAKGGGAVDVKVVNASREWVGRYLLGNARVSLDDCQRLPAIVKRR